MSANVSEQREVHWQRTRSLMIVHLVIWFIFAYLIQWFAHDLNSIKIAGFPLGYYMAAQGSLFAFVIQLFIFVKQQERIDRECGMAEDDQEEEMSLFRMKGEFIDNLPKIYGIYTGGFLIFVLLMAVPSRWAPRSDTIGLMFVGFTIVIYALIGWLSRTMQIDAYYVAGRQVPPVFNGMATAADWMSGASFVAMAGGIYMGGHPYLAFVVGWTGGYVLVAVLMAPYLRKFGCYTVPDFIGTRYGGNLARLFAVLVLIVASFTYVTAQINATGTIAARALLHALRGRGVVRARRHPAVLDAGRHARGDLDPGRAVHRADHRLPGAGVLDVEQAGFRPDPAVRLRRRDRAHRGAGDSCTRWAR